MSTQNSESEFILKLDDTTLIEEFEESTLNINNTKCNTSCDINCTYKCEGEYILSKEKNTEQIYKLYPVEKYGFWTKERCKTDFEECNLEDIIDLLELDNCYHFRVHKKTDYTFFGDIDGYKKDINEFKSIFFKFMKQFYSLDIKSKDFKYTKNEGDNTSYHFSIPKYYCSTEKLKEIMCNLKNYCTDKYNSDFIYKVLDKKTNELVTKNVIDVVIYREGWFRYPQQSKNSEKNTRHLIEYGSVVDFIVEYIQENSECIEDINYKGKKVKKNNINKQTNVDKTNDEQDNNYSLENYYQGSQLDKNTLKMVLKLVGILNESRADDYNEWLYLGFCLHNIDSSLLELWKEFSKKSNKHKEYECDELWKTFRSDGYTIASLYYWAHSDNPDKYYDIIFDGHTDLIEYGLSGTEYDLINIFYEFKKDLIVSVSDKEWYIYKKGLWYHLTSKNTGIIRKKIVKTLMPIYVRYCKCLTTKLEKADNDEHIKLRKKINLCIRVIKKLKSNNFVKSLADNLSATKFSDIKFTDKLINNDKNIFCCGQYILDLNTFEWRKTTPYDYCVVKSGVIKNEITNKNIDELNKIISDIFPDKDIKIYLLDSLSLIFIGNIKQDFYLWRGKGGNGKSLLCKLIMLAFGEYCADLPITLLTQKEQGANKANDQLYKTIYAKVVIAQEPEENAKLNNSYMKKLTGGDKITCRQLYCSPVSFTPKWIPIICCNSSFELQDVKDESIPRRLKYLSFKSIFKENPTLSFHKQAHEEYMTTEFLNKLKGSFIWLLLEHYKKLKNNNFKIKYPQSILNEQKTFIDDNNDVKVFIDEIIEQTDDKNDFTKMVDLFRKYKSWAYENGKKEIKRKELRERLIELFGDQCTYKAVHNYKDEKNKYKQSKQVFLCTNFNETEEL